MSAAPPRARPSWDETFLDVARTVARRSTCRREGMDGGVGCALVRDRRIVATGYNGSLPGDPHCLDEGHLLDDGDPPRCVRSVHAEANAVANAARVGVSISGATAYVTRVPCPACYKLLLAAGIERVVAPVTPRDQARGAVGLLESVRGGGVRLDAVTDEETRPGGSPQW